MAISSSAASARGSGFLSLRLPTVRGWIGNIGWPILLKELRGDFRRSRFFVTHFMCVLAIAIAVMVQIWIKRESENLTSVQLGRSLFDTFFGIQFLVVLIVFPALTSTAFTEERANKSLDLLITTDLRPGELVLGKFLATSAYCLITVFATVPLLAISTLFGGVQIEEIFIAYAILVGHTLVVAMIGVFFSSCYSANLRSTLTVYTIVFGYMAMLWFTLWDPVKKAWQEAGDRTLIAVLMQRIAGSASADEMAVTGGEGVQLLIGLVLVVGFAFAYLFTLTTNRVRTSTDDKSSNLRALTTLLLFLYLLACVVQPSPDASNRLEQMVRIDSILATRVWTTLLILFVAALTFPTEPLELSRRVQARFSRLRGPLAALRIFAPGSFWGLLYLAFLLVVSTAALLLLLQHAASWLDAGTLASVEDQQRWYSLIDRWRDVIITFPLYVLAFGALGFYLSSSGFTRGYCFLTVFFIFIITLLLPVIFEFQKFPDGIYSLYYLSPFTLWSSLNPPELPDEDGPRFVVLGGVAIIDFAKVFYPVLTAVLTGWAIAIARRRGVPLARMARRVGLKARAAA